MSGSAPAEGGSYALVLRVANYEELSVGKIGEIQLQAGIYLYLGSALGPGGLRARINHHLRLAAKPHWHLDWLRPRAAVEGYWWASGGRSLECVWAQGLLAQSAALVPKPGFGSSDCPAGCPAHLLFFGKMDRLCTWREWIEEILTGLSGPVSYCGCDPGSGSAHESAGAPEYRVG